MLLKEQSVIAMHYTSGKKGVHSRRRCLTKVTDCTFNLAPLPWWETRCFHLSLYQTLFSLSCFSHSLLYSSSAECGLYFLLLQPCPLLRGIWAWWRWRAKQCNLPVASCILLLVYLLLCSLLNFHSLYKSNFPLTYIGVCLSEKGVQMPDSAHWWLRWQIDWECCYIWGHHVGKGESGFAYIFNLYILTSDF